MFAKSIAKSNSKAFQALSNLKMYFRFRRMGAGVGFSENLLTSVLECLVTLAFCTICLTEYYAHRQNFKSNGFVDLELLSGRGHLSSLVLRKSNPPPTPRSTAPSLPPF